MPIEMVDGLIPKYIPESTSASKHKDPEKCCICQKNNDSWDSGIAGIGLDLMLTTIVGLMVFDGLSGFHICKLVPTIPSTNDAAVSGK